MYVRRGAALHNICTLKIEVKTINMYVRRGVQRIIIKWRRGVREKMHVRGGVSKMYLPSPVLFFFWNSPKHFYKTLKCIQSTHVY